MVRPEWLKRVRFADVVVALAVLQFEFQLGGAISLCISQTLFLQSLTSNIKSSLPRTSAHAIIDAGANRLLAMTESPTELLMLKTAYMDAIQRVFILLSVASGLAFLASFGFEHKDVKRIEEEQKKMRGSDDHDTKAA